jgi:hypothetical protein
MTAGSWYSKRAVFTARVVQLLGAGEVNGKRFSNRVVAVVHHRYWGLPAYWPSVVILDGGLFCGMAMDEEEYLVSARLGRYGMLDFDECSRTQPLATAQVDLRTLDGSLCTGPGGTLIGKVFVGKQSYLSGNWRDRALVRNAVLTFRDSYGKPYLAQSDGEGVYELRHVPPGRYWLDSPFGGDRYAAGGGDVHSGVCEESSVDVSTYSFSGRLAPGIGLSVSVEMIRSDKDSRDHLTATIASDGRFYFEAIPPGEYILLASFRLAGESGKGAKVYYPGTRQQEKAIRILVSDQTRGRSFDFDPDTIPLVLIPFLVESPDPSHPIRIDVRVVNDSGIVVAGFLSMSGIPISVPAVRGEGYRISADGFSRESLEEPDRKSETVRVTAAGGMKITQIAFPTPH